MLNLRPLLMTTVVVFVISTGFAVFAALLEGIFGIKSSTAFWECLTYVVAGSEALAIFLVIIAFSNPKSMTIDKDL